MRKYCIYLIVLVFILGIVIGYTLHIGKQKYYVPPLKVTGDVKEPIQLRDQDKMENFKIKYRGQDYRAFKLVNLIEQALPSSGKYDLVLIGDDGLSALLAGDELKESYLNYSVDNGWQAINLNHPVVSNIKHIREIVVCAFGSLPEEALRIITPDKNITGLTAGNLLKEGVTVYPYFEGFSTFRVKGKDYRVSIYSRKKTVSLERLVGKKIEERALVVGAKGETFVFNKGFLEIKDNVINYFDPETDRRISDLRGVILKAPILSNRDAYYDALYYLEQNKKVLLILLDGFGFHQYKYAIEHGYAPFLRSIEPARKALTVYRPVTNAGLAAILTGVGPERNGIYSRKQKELRCEDIFIKVKEMGKTCANIEGDIKIINTSVEPLLNPDLNRNGMTDDEVLSAAIGAIKEDNSFIFVHFHGIDDAGHLYGDLSGKTMERVRLIDGYLRRLVSIWPGKVIITADHGMHADGDGGDHGIICYQDLFVPYIMTDGGEY